LEELEGRTLLATFTVIDLGDSGAGSGLQGDLRYCVNTANSNNDLSNHIVFEQGLTGTIGLSQGVLVLTKNLEITGPGADLLTVSGNHSSGVFEIAKDSGAQDVRLSGLTVADGVGVFTGSAFLGGGLLNWRANVTLTDCIFAGNAVGGSVLGQGGAIYHAAGDLVMTRCSVIDNHADGPAGSRAGGLYVDGGSATLDHCTIAGNTSTMGVGGIFNNGTLTATDTVVSGNSGSIGGGIQDEYVMTWTRCTIVGNVAQASAGGVNANGVDTFIDCTIADNVTATGVGGGLYNSGVGQLTLKGSTVSGNSAPQGGGGLWWAGGVVEATDSTFSGNTGGNGPGGGILMPKVSQGGLLQLTSCTLTANVAASGGGLDLEDPNLIALVRNSILAENQAQGSGADVVGTVLSLGYNLVGEADGSTGWRTSDLTGTSNDPLDPRLGALKANGGLTLTHAPLPDSPAIDHGDPAESRSFDQRGTFRVFDAKPPDIGSVEAEPAVAFVVIVPSQVTAGQPFAMTVVAVDEWGNTATTYAGTVSFDSTDLGAVLPPDYTFTPSDQGEQTFSVTLNTPGFQLLRVTDTDKPDLMGTAGTFVTT
jgi:hypothetical protein